MEYLLRENVVSDNVLKLAKKGYSFKGGYIAIVKENVFQNAWQDRETVKKFRKENSLRKYLAKNYKDCDYLDDLDFTGTCLDN